MNINYENVENKQSKVTVTHQHHHHKRNIQKKLQNQENKRPQSIYNADSNLDDLLEMLREDLILRNKVDLKICKESHFAIGRRRPRVLVEYVEDLFIKGRNKKQMQIRFLTTANN